ncbi:hypothetical protein BD626DRAFT_546545 [Schizophyllum amplum]|uniref:Uncharacterized protein n=1 Tax=Schizophyllum amplum TaxID=97359 RepID=A0A550CNA3_9AGAR|nr:hypothetical protein BD626DRAFT_546545 [Auriculariopsis ampla]
MLLRKSWFILLLAAIAHASPVYDPVAGLLDGDGTGEMEGHRLQPTPTTSMSMSAGHSETASTSSSATVSGSLSHSSPSAKSTSDKDHSSKSSLVPATTEVIVDRGGTTHTYTEHRTSYQSRSLPAPTLTQTFSSVPYTATPTLDANKTAAAARSHLESQQWKAIGIAALSLAVVAAIVLGVYFWDKYRAALRDIFGCGRRRNDKWADNLEVEGNKAWEARIAAEDGHRYPTLDSLEEIERAREKAGYGDAAVHEKGQPFADALPVPLHLGFEDAEHPMSPFYRRPSLRGQSPTTPRAVMMQPKTTTTAL